MISRPTNASLDEISNGAEINDLGARHEERKKRRLGGGLGAGIALAMLVPGAGWIAGGMLALSGMLMGALFMPDIKSLKKIHQETGPCLFPGCGMMPYLFWEQITAKLCEYLIDRLEPDSLAASLVERDSRFLRGTGNGTGKLHPGFAAQAPSFRMTWLPNLKNI